MASTQFIVKEVAKEKEILKEKEHFKPEKDKTEKEHKEKGEKDAKDKPEKESKEKSEKEAKDKLEKEHKDGKNEQKDKQEKEKHEKELKERHPKEGKDKEGKFEQLEKAFENVAIGPAERAQAEQVAGAPGAVSAVSPKVDEKFIFEKVQKLEKHEKFEFEKFEFEKVRFDGKQLVEVGIPVQSPGDPGLAQRVATMEAVMGQLLHFIPENLRPDLSKGALIKETDAKPDTPAGTTKQQEKSEEDD
jgi:hypothetical protein